MALVLIRHTRVAIADGHCYGRLDVPLAGSAAADIADVLVRVAPVTVVVSSPATRCRQLSVALAARDGCPLQFEPALQELDFGEWEGRRWAEIDRAHSDPWALDPWNLAPPGGESEAALWTRLQRWLEDDFAAGAAGAAGAKRLAIVAHGGPLRLLRCHFEGRPREQRWSRSLALGEVVELGGDPRLSAPTRAGPESA